MTDRKVDPAALAGAVLAATLAVQIEPGPYDLINFIQGATLLLLLFAYVLDGKRSVVQSAAAAAVVALVALLLAGPLWELFHGGGYFTGKPRADCVFDPITRKPRADCVFDTAVTDCELFVSWAGIGVLIWAGDLLYQWRRTDSPRKSRALPPLH